MYSVLYGKKDLNPHDALHFARWLQESINQRNEGSAGAALIPYALNGVASYQS